MEGESESESESESGGWQKSGGLADASALCCLQAGSWHQHGATRCPHIPPLNHSHHHPSLDCPPFPTTSCRPLSPRRHSCWMTSACWCTGAPQRCWRGRTATRGGCLQRRRWRLLLLPSQPPPDAGISLPPPAHRTGPLPLWSCRHTPSSAHGQQGSFLMIFNLATTQVEHLFVAHSPEFAAWWVPLRLPPAAGS